MKILSLNHKPPFPSVDGGSAASLGLLEALSLRHQVTSLAYATGKHPLLESQESAGFEQRVVAVNLSGLTSAARIAVGCVVHRGAPALLRRYRVRRFARSLRETLIEVKPDVVLLDGLPTAVWLDELREHRVAYRAHNAESLILEERGTSASRSWGDRFIAASKTAVERTRALERQLVNGGHPVLAISTGVADYYKNLAIRDSNDGNACANVSYIPVPMSTRAVPETLPSTVFHLGAMDWWPNQEAVRWLLTGVWPLVLRQHPELHLHLAGRHSNEWFARARLQMGPPDSQRVEIDGTVGSAAAYMRTHGILAAPTLVGSGVKIKILEAMACGRAVVTTSLGAEGLGATAGDHLLVADTAEEFAAALSLLVTFPEMRLALGKSAHAYVREHHDPANIAEHFSDAVF